MDDIMETVDLRKAYKGNVVVNDVNIHIPKGGNLWICRFEWCRKKYGYENDFEPCEAGRRGGPAFWRKSDGS